MRSFLTIDLAHFLKYNNSMLSPYRKIIPSLKYFFVAIAFKSIMLRDITLPWNKESQLATWIFNL